MTTARQERARDAGVTLVELMVSVLLFSILVFGAIAALSGQQRVSSSQQRASIALDNARATLTALARQIRTAGGAIPKGQLVINDINNLPSGTTTSCGSGVIPIVQVTDSSTGPDELRVIFPAGDAWGGVLADVSPSTTGVQMRTADGALPSKIQKGDFAVLSTFDDTDAAVLFQLTTAPVSGSPCAADFCLQKSSGSPSPWTSPAPAKFEPGDFVIRARWLRYEVDTKLFGSDEPALLMTDQATSKSEPAAVGIEDFQVALWFDLNDDGKIYEVGSSAGDDELVYNVAGETVGTTSGIDDDCDMDQLQGIRISIVAKAVSKEPGATAARPALEDRSAGSKDGYYRVVQRTLITLRN